MQLYCCTQVGLRSADHHGLWAPEALNNLSISFRPSYESAARQTLPKTSQMDPGHSPFLSVVLTLTREGPLALFRVGRRYDSHSLQPALKVALRPTKLLMQPVCHVAVQLQSQAFRLTKIIDGHTPVWLPLAEGSILRRFSLAACRQQCCQLPTFLFCRDHIRSEK